MMKKKFFAVALATTMTVSTVMTASAETISGAWWTSWSQGYEVADGETVEFDMELKGGDAVWNNVAAVFVNGHQDGHCQYDACRSRGYQGSDYRTS